MRLLIRKTAAFMLIAIYNQNEITLTYENKTQIVNGNDITHIYFFVINKVHMCCTFVMLINNKL